MSTINLSGIDPRLSEADLRAVGLLGIQIITERTARGIDADGEPFKPYSAKPFAMPAGAVTQRARAALKKELSFFKTKRGELWMIVQGGYEALKRAAYPQDAGTVNLWAKGLMIPALTIVSVDVAARTVVLGFTDQEQATKAFYHNVAGAGRGHVIRRFLGFTDEERGQLAAYAATRIVVKSGGSSGRARDARGRFI